MPQEKSVSTAAEARQLFADVLKDNESLKIRTGQTVVLNDSNIGKQQNRLETETFSSISEAVFADSGDRVDIPLTDKGNQKAPEIEVVGVSGKGKEGERVLFRQEKGLGISVNEVGDLLRTRTEVAPAEVTSPEVAPADTERQSEAGSQLNEALLQEAISIQEEIIAAQDVTIAVQEETIGSISSRFDNVVAVQDETIAVQNETIDSFFSQFNGGQPEANSQLNETSSQPVARDGESTAITVFTQLIDELPQSKTKALWNRIANDFKALGQQLKDAGQKGKEIAGAVKEAPDAVKQDVATLANRTKQQLADAKQDVAALADRTKQQIADAKQSVRTTIAQTSIDDVASTAIKGASAVAGVASKGLGIANLYLKNRADKIKSYGMAKAALRLYEKGHARTGESIFTANNYTVEAVTDGFKVKDSSDRLLMSFGTDDKGRPVSITKGAALQPEDYKQINQASKLPVIEGSPAAEAAYAQRLSKVAEGLKEIVAEGDTLSGRSFHISRENPQVIALTTQGIPRREMTVNLADGTQASTLTMEDLDQVEANIETSLSIQAQYVAPELSASEPKQKAQVEMV